MIMMGWWFFLPSPGSTETDPVFHPKSCHFPVSREQAGASRARRSRVREQIPKSDVKKGREGGRKDRLGEERRVGNLGHIHLGQQGRSPCTLIAARASFLSGSQFAGDAAPCSSPGQCGRAAASNSMGVPLAKDNELHPPLDGKVTPCTYQLIH